MPEDAARERWIDTLLGVIARLRGPGGCPWDREQTLDSLRPYLLEECYELLEALDSGDPARHLDELGDVLLQVVLQARIREEQGAFAFEDVARVLSEKMVRRHPHVFGDVQVTGTQDVLRNWDAIKATEKEQPEASALDGLPPALPALQKAQRLQSRAARQGFDWPEASGVWAKLDEELAEVRAALATADAAKVEDEIGDLLFTIVNLSRRHHVTAEEALRRASAKFERRFREVERRMRAEGRALSADSLADMDRHWNAVKADESA